MKHINNFPNHQISEGGQITNIKTNKVLTPTLKKTGYLAIRLSKNNKSYEKSVHRLVYEAYGEPIINGNQIHHKNGIKTDNRIENLIQMTCSENIAQRVNIRKGEQVNTAKLNAEQIKEIRIAKANGERTTNLMRKYGVCKSTINRIASGICWKHLDILPVDNTIWSNPSITGKLAHKKQRL